MLHIHYIIHRFIKLRNFSKLAIKIKIRYTTVYTGNFISHQKTRNQPQRETVCTGHNNDVMSRKVTGGWFGNDPRGHIA